MPTAKWNTLYLGGQPDRVHHPRGGSRPGRAGAALPGHRHRRTRNDSLLTPDGAGANDCDTDRPFHGRSRRVFV
jgi:hypothetical protein